MNRILPLALLGLSAVTLAATLLPNPGTGRDNTKMPDPVARENELAAKPISLAKAIEIATKDGGVVASAAFAPSGQIDVTLVHAGAERALVVDSNSGAIISIRELPLFPGEPVTGPGITMATGLRYWDIKVGEGAEAIAKTSQASVHYTGWLLDGTQFDSSIPRRQPYPVTLATGGVVEGWLQGIPGMKVGGKRKLVVPANLGYGVIGKGAAIGSNMILVFDLELMAVK